MLPRVWRVAETSLRKRGRGDEQLEFPLQFVTFLSIVLVQNLCFKKIPNLYDSFIRYTQFQTFSWAESWIAAPNAASSHHLSSRVERCCLTWQEFQLMDFLLMLWRHQTNVEISIFTSKAYQCRLCNPQKKESSNAVNETNSILGQKKPHCNHSIVLVWASLV